MGRNIAVGLLDRASKKGKGQQQPVPIGALYRGAKQHVAMKTGGNDEVQLKVAQLGVGTSSETYVVAHSAHVTVRFVAVTWNELPPLEALDAGDDDSDNVNYRPGRHLMTQLRATKFQALVRKPAFLSRITWTRIRVKTMHA